MVNLVSPETESSLVADPQVLILVYRTMVTLKGATPTPALHALVTILAMLSPLCLVLLSHEPNANLSLSSDEGATTPPTGTHHLRHTPWLFLIRRQLVRLCLFVAETFLPALSLVFQIPLQLPVLPLHALVILAMLSLLCPVLLSHEPNANLSPRLDEGATTPPRTFLETYCLCPTLVLRLHVMINVVSPGMGSSVAADPPVLCRPHLLFLLLVIRTLVTLEGAIPTPATIGSREVLIGTHHLLRLPWLFLLRRQWRLYTQVQTPLPPIHPRLSTGEGRDDFTASPCSVSGDHRISTRGTYRSAHLSVVTPARSARDDHTQSLTLASVADTRRLTREDILGHTPSIPHASVTTARDDHSGASRNEEGAAGYPPVFSSRRGGDRTRPTGIASAVAESRATRSSVRGHTGRDTLMSVPREHTPPPRLTGRQSAIRALAGGSASFASAITTLLAPTRPRPSSRPPN